MRYNSDALTCYFFRYQLRKRVQGAMVKILIVEDEEPIANLIRMNLKKTGYACECAYDGQEAADRMEEGHYDLLLLDIMLPKINGYELMEYAKSIQLPVIFITAMDSTENKVKGLKMGAEDYLAKPLRLWSFWQEWKRSCAAVTRLAVCCIYWMWILIYLPARLCRIISRFF